MNACGIHKDELWGLTDAGLIEGPRTQWDKIDNGIQQGYPTLQPIFEALSPCVIQIGAHLVALSFGEKNRTVKVYAHKLTKAGRELESVIPQLQQTDGFIEACFASCLEGLDRRGYVFKVDDEVAPDVAAQHAASEVSWNEAEIRHQTELAKWRESTKKP